MDISNFSEGPPVAFAVLYLSSRCDFQVEGNICMSLYLINYVVRPKNYFEL
jgi:hypothetical protein